MKPDCPVTGSIAALMSAQNYCGNPADFSCCLLQAFPEMSVYSALLSLHSEFLYCHSSMKTPAPEGTHSGSPVRKSFVRSMPKTAVIILYFPESVHSALLTDSAIPDSWQGEWMLLSGFRLLSSEPVLPSSRICPVLPMQTHRYYSEASRRSTYYPRTVSKIFLLLFLCLKVPFRYLKVSALLILPMH